MRTRQGATPKKSAFDRDLGYGKDPSDNEHKEPMKIKKLTIVLQPCKEGGYSTYIKEIRGAISQGATEREAIDNVLDAKKQLSAVQGKRA